MYYYEADAEKEINWPDIGTYTPALHARLGSQRRNI